MISHLSAVCYYFGKALHKRMSAEGEVVPIGLLKIEWGGSMIESWVPEANPVTGETYCTERESRVGRTPGKLYNSMIMPVSNVTIKGWLWYQGEQNGGNPGSYLNKTGYACLLPALDNAWRHAFREGSATDPEFPIGVVSLHGWCGEEEANCVLDPNKRTDNTAKIRWAQTADWGFLPNPRLPHGFVAMAYDQPDPQNGTHCFWNTTRRECTNVPYPEMCVAGKEVCPPPAGLMGGNIHPRNKLLLGERIARAAKAMAYNDVDVAFTGPVVTGCSVTSDHAGDFSDGGDSTVAFSFNETLMRGEAMRVKVRRGFEVRNAATGNWSWVAIATPLGVQAEPTVEIAVPAGVVVDAVRYNWLDNIACPGAYCDYTKPTANQSCSDAHPHNRGTTEQNFWWCFNPMETIALYTESSALPAPPFTLEVTGDRCVMPSGVV